MLIKIQMRKIKIFIDTIIDVVFALLINVKMPTIIGFFNICEQGKFMLS